MGWTRWEDLNHKAKSKGEAMPDENVYETTTNVTDGQEVEKETQVKDEVPPEVAAKMHAPYPEKPPIQELNESLVNKTPTGYEPHADINDGAKLDETLAKAREAKVAAEAPSEDQADAQPASGGGTVGSYSGVEGE